MTDKKIGHPQAAQENQSAQFISNKPPQVFGQHAFVLELIQEHQPILALSIKFDFDVPEAGARISELRDMGFQIKSSKVPPLIFHGKQRRNAVNLSLDSPAWSAEFARQRAAKKKGKRHG